MPQDCTPNPVRYQGVASSSLLKPNPVVDGTGHIPFRYSTKSDWRSYDKAIIDPIEIYRGPDDQSGHLSEEDKNSLAQYKQLQLTKKLQKTSQLTNVVEPNTLRIHPTLSGATTNTPLTEVRSREPVPL